MSSIAVFIAGAVYSGYVRNNRGHLLHLSRCLKNTRGIGVKHPGRYSNIGAQEPQDAEVGLGRQCWLAT